MPFAPKIAFVDVETTGTSPTHGRVTEVGIVTVTHEPDAQSAARVEAWSTLVNPGMPIPPAIRFLTGISDEMVASAPPFRDIAGQVSRRLEGAVFVAHQARFDYGFIRNEFSRAGIDFHASTLCTVRMSRLLFPDRSPHTLDAIIARLRLPVEDRHRALGDARVLWEFIQALYRRFPRAEVDAAAQRLLRHPNLPAHLPPDATERLPAAAGVYAFLGLNDHPLYIGSSTNLRQRVAAHFCGDHHSERGVRLASETRRIEVERTAGELGARLLEAEWIATRMPAHNVALRRRDATVFASLDADTAAIRYVAAISVDPRRLPTLLGPFASRASARAALGELARTHALCEKSLGLERGRKGVACFRHQLGRCLGACIGAESAQSLARRADAAFAPLKVPQWPFDGAIAIVERAHDASREDWMVFDQWCHLGCADSREAATALAGAAGAPRFERTKFAIARSALAQRCSPSGAANATPDATIVVELWRAPHIH